jgi:hypothetical protein
MQVERREVIAYLPVIQTKFGKGEGNCWASCIAAITGIPLEQVPNFCLNESWLTDTIDWLKARNFGVCYVDSKVDGQDMPEETRLYANVPFIATGRSPRGDWYHCCVYGPGTLLHDPHPNGGGIMEPIRDALFIFPMFSPVVPE